MQWLTSYVTDKFRESIRQFNFLNVHSKNKTPVLGTPVLDVKLKLG